eukprot:1231798-Pyramimonas_sp.AAC.1
MRVARYALVKPLHPGRVQLLRPNISRRRVHVRLGFPGGLEGVCRGSSGFIFLLRDCNWSGGGVYSYRGTVTGPAA